MGGLKFYPLSTIHYPLGRPQAEAHGSIHPCDPCSSVVGLFLKPATDNYSSFSGSSEIPFSPAAFFSQYFVTQASQVLPAAMSRPLKASAAMSENRMVIFSRESFGITRTADSASVAPMRRSKM